MKAGRELDALIAEKVMGFCLHTLGGTHDLTHAESECRRCEKMIPDEEFFKHKDWSPSTRIADAWLVVEKLEKHDDVVLFSITRKSEITDELQWFAKFRKVLGNQHDYIVRAATAPLAICLAALKAVE